MVLSKVCIPFNLGNYAVAVSWHILLIIFGVHDHRMRYLNIYPFLSNSEKIKEIGHFLQQVFLWKPNSLARLTNHQVQVLFRPPVDSKANQQCVMIMIPNFAVSAFV